MISCLSSQQIQIPFYISNKSVLFLDDSLVMHSVKISFLLQPDKSLLCPPVDDTSFFKLILAVGNYKFYVYDTVYTCTMYVQHILLKK